MKKSLTFLILLLFFLSRNLYSYDEQPVYMRTTAPYQGFLKSSFSIERKTIRNHYIPHATGFYIRYESLPYAVTARHVVQKKIKNGKNEVAWGEFKTPLFIRMHTDDKNVPTKSKHKEISIINNKKYDGLYFFHRDSSIDAVIFPVFFKKNISEVSLQLPYEMIQKDEFVLTGEDVHIFGFPGPYGFEKGKSVVRSGTICFKLNKNIYLLDANTWPGDSGGMVVSKPYFGILKENHRNSQWHIGGKLIGLYIGRRNPQDFKGFNLPESLEAFRLIVSGQTLIDMIDSDEFKKYHKNWKIIWAKIKGEHNKSQP